MADLEELRRSAQACTDCVLHEGRTQVVFGRGNPAARILLVGEGPGKDEDLQGLPFVGAAGQLLDKILAAVDLSEQDVYISNTVLCRPPKNRAPEPTEVSACARHRSALLAVLDPPIVVLLGATATKAVLGPKTSVTAVRGSRIVQDGRAYYPTFHPAALLRDPSKKRPVWHDFQRIAKDYRLILDGAADDAETEPWPAPDGAESR
ncbi:MAG: uracil-DNA glycosylase [Thermaerobacter sp.]|nr:uracil-DNA glycosylase [Thermaerobacter sp.]